MLIDGLISLYVGSSFTFLRKITHAQFFEYNSVAYETVTMSIEHLAIRDESKMSSV